MYHSIETTLLQHHFVRIQFIFLKAVLHKTTNVENSQGIMLNQ